MTLFSQYFNLGKNQYELDFVDVPIDRGDIPLFIDPYAISRRTDRWSIQCHNLIIAFFQAVIDDIREDQGRIARIMLSGLREPNQTRFGLSTGTHARGRGVSGKQARQLLRALADSTAVQTGFLRDLEDCELMIPGIGRDKISDITTNIIRNRLIRYTQYQCMLNNIPMHQVPSGPLWDNQARHWTQEYVHLPVCNRRSVFLVPKAIARFDMEFNHQQYYQHFVLNFLQQEHLSANSALVRTLKDGTKKEPTKKSLKEIHPLSKQFLYEFSNDHPEVLDRYKRSKTYNISEITDETLIAVGGEDVRFDPVEIKAELDALPAGNEAASAYHKCIKGILTYVFYPFVINPVMEAEIHEGRKRIDKVFENAAHDGFFESLPRIKAVPSAYIMVECKNYSGDPANPALDQLSGRFAVNRGQFGFLVCRNFQNKDLFSARCKDTARDGRGYIIALDDEDIKALIDLRAAKDIQGFDRFFDDKFRMLVM